MADSQEQKTFRWSFSQWEAYNECPQKWKFQSVLKLPRKPPGGAAARGLSMHDRAEKYIKGEIDLNTCLFGTPGKTFDGKPEAVISSKYIPVLDEFRDHPNGDRYTEKKLAFSDEWTLTSHKDPKASCIAVLDAARFSRHRATDPGVLHIGEWKSGKPKDTHSEQRKLYAMFGMRAWMADEVHVTTYYLEDTSNPERVTLKSEAGYEKLKTIWMSRAEEMRTNQICAPRPGFYCRWCDFGKKSGGPCQFGD